MIFLMALNCRAAASALAAIASDPPKGLQTVELEGKVGPYTVGMNLLVSDNTAIAGGHYFYASKSADIPLDGRAVGEKVILREPSGGVFDLHLVSNGSAVGQPLNFYISTGLRGTWTKAGKTIPATFGFTTIYEGHGPKRWYSDVTNETDGAFERRVRTFLRAVMTNDKTTAVNFVSYPLRVYHPKAAEIRTKARLLANWDRVFTPALKQKLQQAIPHEMFVHNGMVMVANGIVWFDGKGAAVINN